MVAVGQASDGSTEGATARILPGSAPPERDELDLLPQQGRMRLVDAILDRGEARIRVAATVSERWPTAEGGSVHAALLIELVAQGAALLGTQLGGDSGGKLALLVGLPEVTLEVSRVRVGARLVAEVRVARGSGDYLVCEGEVHEGTARLAAVTVQGIRLDAAAAPPAGGHGG